MGFFKKEIIIYKDAGNAAKKRDSLAALLEDASGAEKERLAREHAAMEVLAAEEKNILDELRIGAMDMVILPDVCLEEDGQRAEIDLVVITNRLCFMISYKNLSGETEIDESGRFFRISESDGERVRTEIESPLEVNKRNLEVMRNIVLGKQTGFRRTAKNMAFNTYYTSLAVLPDPDAHLIADHAPIYIRESFVPLDKLLDMIRMKNFDSRGTKYSIKEMKQQADYFLARQAKE